VPKKNAIVMGTVALAPDAFWLKSATQGAQHFIVIAASDDRGLLYGAFALPRKITLGESLANLGQRETPYAPAIRCGTFRSLRRDGGTGRRWSLRWRMLPAARW